MLHTNLGRALLSPQALERMTAVAAAYSNLELDLASKERGSRYSHVEGLLRRLTGAEDALVVNNNAAAVLLALETLAHGKEVIVSRGELIEIGGEFRIPDIMLRSGAVLREVGATNRTHLRDYAEAIGPATALLLKVHTSNYRVIGFTADVSSRELTSLGRERGIPVMEDLGSGSLVDLRPWGFPHEPTVPEVVASGVDLVSFSGDKLLGGPQAGIVVGKRAIVGRLKKNPWNRALRIDKFTIAALEATLTAYEAGTARETIPTLRLLTEPLAGVLIRARRVQRGLGPAVAERLAARVVEDRAQVGVAGKQETNRFGMIPADPIEELHTGHLRHALVAHDDVDLLLLHQPDALGGPRRPQHLVIEAQQVLDALHHVRFVVYDQDRMPPIHEDLPPIIIDKSAMRG